MPAAPIRIGIDLGGTKIALAALGEAGKERFARRMPTQHPLSQSPGG